MITITQHLPKTIRLESIHRIITNRSSQSKGKTETPTVRISILGPLHTLSHFSEERLDTVYSVEEAKIFTSRDLIIIDLSIERATHDQCCKVLDISLPRLRQLTARVARKLNYLASGQLEIDLCKSASPEECLNSSSDNCSKIADFVSTRALKVLEKHGISSILDALLMSDHDLAALKGLGKKMITEITAYRNHLLSQAVNS